MPADDLALRAVASTKPKDASGSELDYPLVFGGGVQLAGNNYRAAQPFWAIPSSGGFFCNNCYKTEYYIVKPLPSPPSFTNDIAVSHDIDGQVAALYYANGVLDDFRLVSDTVSAYDPSQEFVAHNAGRGTQTRNLTDYFFVNTGSNTFIEDRTARQLPGGGTTTGALFVDLGDDALPDLIRAEYHTGLSAHKARFVDDNFVPPVDELSTYSALCAGATYPNDLDFATEVCGGAQ